VDGTGVGGTGVGCAGRGVAVAAAAVVAVGGTVVAVASGEPVTVAVTVGVAGLAVAVAVVETLISPERVGVALACVLADALAAGLVGASAVESSPPHAANASAATSGTDHSHRVIIPLLNPGQPGAHRHARTRLQPHDDRTRATRSGVAMGGTRTPTFGGRSQRQSPARTR
jgi:hypothetical protein